MTNNIALFVGDITVDLSISVSDIPGPDEKVDAISISEAIGGVATNAAMACAISGSSTRLVICVGDDQYGRNVAEELSGMGIDTLVSSTGGVTSRAVTLIDRLGEKRLILCHGVSMYPDFSQINVGILEGVGWVHSAIYDIAAAELLFKHCKESAVPWSLDLEPSTFLDGLNSLSGCIDGAEVLFCNEKSIAAIGPSAVQRLMSMGAKNVILTKGKGGAVLCEKEQQTHIEAPTIFPIDTTGAGDCLAGWFICERMSGCTPQRSLASAVLAASISCSRTGTRSSFPSRAEVQKFQQTKKLETL